MFHVIIPARFAASRLPGKPLLDLGGRPLIRWTWQRAVDSGAASVTIACDDERIRRAARGFDARCVLTSGAHASGTDRIAEAVRTLGFAPGDTIVNLQADEPLLPPELIVQVATALDAAPDAGIATAITPVQTLAEFVDPNCVKAVCALDGRALHFSRAPIPWPREHSSAGKPARFDGACRHIGIYAYRVSSLLQFAAWPPTTLERCENLEQLRALEHGMRIQVVTTLEPPPAGVDTGEDLQRVRALLVSGGV